MTIRQHQRRYTWPWVIFWIILSGSSCQPEQQILPIEVETGSIEEVGPTFCMIQGEVIQVGKQGILQHGFVWSESANPVYDSSQFVILGVAHSPGTFSSTLTGLSPSTTYHVRAFARGVSQTSYGTEKTFETEPPAVPSLHTLQAFGIRSTSARAGGEILSDGGSDILEQGICWSSRPNPTTEDNKVEGVLGSELFEGKMEPLDPFIVYFYRAYAVNGVGISYGEQFGFKTLWDNSVITDFDGNSYETVQVADQVWMAENMRTTHMSDGTPIDRIEEDVDWMLLGSDAKAYSFYENRTTAPDTFGILYTWSAALNGAESSNDLPSGIQGICPDGWHIPSDEEWKILEVEMGMSELISNEDGWRGWDEGGKLKLSGTSLWKAPNDLATNESGFSALPAGFRDADGSFSHLGSFTGFWTTAGYDADGAWMRGLHAWRGEITRDVYPRKNGFSVRCLKD